MDPAIEPQGRWPPVYSAEDLAREIASLTSAKDFDARFWLLSLVHPEGVYQGDIVHLPAELPLIDRDGQIAENGAHDYWIVLGNTCDFVRDVRWTQISPLVSIGDAGPAHEVREHRAYKHSRKFYLPPWPNGDREHRFADFTRPVTLEKAAFGNSAKVIARMQYAAWVLLHSCLIRFLARDDGRHDP